MSKNKLAILFASLLVAITIRSVILHAYRKHNTNVDMRPIVRELYKYVGIGCITSKKPIPESIRECLEYFRRARFAGMSNDTSFVIYFECDVAMWTQPTGDKMPRTLLIAHQSDRERAAAVWFAITDTEDLIVIPLSEANALKKDMCEFSK